MNRDNNFASGDPDDPPGGAVEWLNEQGMPEPSGGNAYSEYCQISMGTSGTPLDMLAVRRAWTIQVKYLVPAGVSPGKCTPTPRSARLLAGDQWMAAPEEL